MRALALLLTLTAPAAAQWDSLPWDSSNPIERGKQLVWHQNQSGTHVFSAHGQRWRNRGGPSTSVLGWGDYCMLLQEASSIRAYSARHDAVAELPTDVFPGIVIVEDDVIFIHDTSNTEDPSVWGYSAQTNSWAEQALTNQVTLGEVAISTHVIGVKDEEEYFGFSARSGQWTTYSAEVSGKPPQADGNLVVVDLNDPIQGGGVRKVAAYSGVTGTWQLSPLYLENTPLLWDHNVAVITAEGDAGSRAVTAFSSYSGQWVVSTHAHIGGSLTFEIHDNWVAVRNGVGSVREAFGAAPGLGWDVLFGNWLDEEFGASDYFLLRNADSTEMLAFSGMVDSGFSPHSAITGFNSLTNNPPQSYAMYVDSGAQYHAYSPARGNWAVQNIGSFGTTFLGDAMFFLRASGQPLTTYCARSGAWSAGPDYQATSTLGIPGESVVVFQEQNGPDNTTTQFFEERQQRWVEVFAAYKGQARAGENVVVLHPSLGSGALGEIYAFSSQTGAVSSPPSGGVVLPIPASPGVQAEGDLITLVDADGKLWAYGGLDAGHLWQQWPAGTEYQVGGPDFGIAFGVRGEPGQVVVPLIGPAPEIPAVNFPGFGGLLALDPTFALALNSMGAVPADGIASTSFFVPAGVLPRGVELYFQPLVLDFNTFSAHFAGREARTWLF